MTVKFCALSAQLLAARFGIHICTYALPGAAAFESGCRVTTLTLPAKLPGMDVILLMTCYAIR